MTDSEFKALALLRFVTLFYQKHKRAPYQREILTDDGSLNDWFDTSGARANYPFGFSGAPTIHRAAALLADSGLMTPRGRVVPEEEKNGKSEFHPYEPTALGMEVGMQLAQTDWRTWEWSY